MNRDQGKRIAGAAALSLAVGIAAVACADTTRSNSGSTTSSMSPGTSATPVERAPPLPPPLTPPPPPPARRAAQGRKHLAQAACFRQHVDHPARGRELRPGDRGEEGFRQVDAAVQMRCSAGSGDSRRCSGARWRRSAARRASTRRRRSRPRSRFAAEVLAGLRIEAAGRRGPFVRANRRDRLVADARLGIVAARQAEQHRRMRDQPAARLEHVDDRLSLVDQRERTAAVVGRRNPPSRRRGARRRRHEGAEFGARPGTTATFGAAGDVAAA